MRLMAPEGGRAVRLLALAGAAGLVAYLAQSLAPALCGDALTEFAEAALYPALVAVGGVLAAIRAARSTRDRLAWAVAAGGILAWAGGDVAAALGGAEGAIPTVADVLWLAFYPAASPPAQASMPAAATAHASRSRRECTARIAASTPPTATSAG